MANLTQKLKAEMAESPRAQALGLAEELLLSDPAVGDKIRKLIAEGKSQRQSVAIALDLQRRGKL